MSPAEFFNIAGEYGLPWAIATLLAVILYRQWQYERKLYERVISEYQDELGSSLKAVMDSMAEIVSSQRLLEQLFRERLMRSGERGDRS